MAQSVMDIEWNYQYYQPWSDNDWLLQELIDNNVIIEEEEKYNDKCYLQLLCKQAFELDKNRDIRLLDNDLDIYSKRKIIRPIYLKILTQVVISLDSINIVQKEREQ